MEYIDLRETLHEEQMYVADWASRRGLDVRAVLHDEVTDTCHEKAKILGWSSDRVVKFIIFSKKGCDRYWGFVFPESADLSEKRTIDQATLFSEIFGISRKKARDFRNGHCLEGMEFGTCTPFVRESSFSSGGLEGIYVHVPGPAEVVDISIGGTGDLWHKTSLHLPYHAISDILRLEFGGERIHTMDLFPSRR